MEQLIHDVVHNYDCNIHLRDHQLECFRFLIQKRGDLIVNLPVGYGKSLLYHLLPRILGLDKDNPVVLVVSPLNIIQEDQLKSLKEHRISACRLDIKCRVESEIESRNELVTDVRFSDVISGRYSVVLCHPEALFNTERGKKLLGDQNFKEKVIGVVIDECHIIERWGEEFRTAFKKLPTLKAFFHGVPLILLSGTLTLKQKENLPKLLHLRDYGTVETTPDRPNIFLSKEEKPRSTDVLSSYEEVFYKECDELYRIREQYPVTLMFLPVFYMSEALMHLNSLFGCQTIETSIYSAMCSGQDEYVVSTTVSELRKENPRIRLVLTTAITGMGFDPENVTRVIHTCPPRNLSQYVQEVGRAGRRGQASTAVLYYNNRDLAKNLPGQTEDIVNYCKNKSTCLRENLLSVFGFQKEPGICGSLCCSFCKHHCTCSTCTRHPV